MRCPGRKRQVPVACKYDFNTFLMNFFGGREDEDKRRPKKWSKLIFSSF